MKFYSKLMPLHTWAIHDSGINRLKGRLIPTQRKATRKIYQSRSRLDFFMPKILLQASLAEFGHKKISPIPWGDFS